MPLTLHIGTYDKSGGQGLVPVTLDEDGAFAVGEPYAGARNASFGVRRGELAYLVDEQQDGTFGVHRRIARGWQPVVRVPSGGAEPCYLALDATGSRLAVANYASGSAALFALGGDGLPEGAPSLFHDAGSGPNAERQEGPHMHCVRFVGDHLYAVDLGTDQVLRIELTATGLGEVSVAWTAPAGAGPRHLLPLPHGRALVVCELAATLSLLGPRGDSLTTLATAPTAPAGFAGENAGGHLAVNAAGTRAYVSNRGHDSIAVFATAENSLELLQHIPSGGRHPRHFVLLEDRARMVVAHEKDGRVTAFAVAGDGTLARSGTGITVPGACFVLA